MRAGCCYAAVCVAFVAGVFFLNSFLCAGASCVVNGAAGTCQLSPLAGIASLTCVANSMSPPNPCQQLGQTCTTQNNVAGVCRASLLSNELACIASNVANSCVLGAACPLSATSMGVCDANRVCVAATNNCSPCQMTAAMCTTMGGQSTAAGTTPCSCPGCTLSTTVEVMTTRAVSGDELVKSLMKALPGFNVQVTGQGMMFTVVVSREMTSPGSNNMIALDTSSVLTSVRMSDLVSSAAIMAPTVDQKPAVAASGAALTLAAIVVGVAALF